MKFDQNEHAVKRESVALASSGNRFIEWIQDPMGMTIAASVLTMSTFGIVLSGTWFVNLFVS